MTTAADQITEFLLARIAEDETEIADARFGDGPEWWMPAQWTHERALASCKTKRDLIELALGVEYLREVDDPKAPHAAVGEDVLRTMAEEWADHPDFDPAWRIAED